VYTSAAIRRVTRGFYAHNGGGGGGGGGGGDRCC